MKQTAVDWFYSQLIEYPLGDWEYFLEQAKAMEKSEKDKQYQRGFKDGSNHIKIIYNL